MANPALVYVVLGASAMYGYASGRLGEFIDKTFKNDNNSNNNPSSKTAPSSQPKPTIIVQSPSSNTRNSYLLPFGCAAVFGLGGYYYFIHSSGTKKVINRVEETAEETQTLVQQTDDNNSKRFEILDKKNENRAQNLEIEIRSEQRAGFGVISDQLYCLQQVAIQTLSAVANLSNNNNDDDNTINEKLIGYADKAQEMADTIISDEHMLKTKENNLKEIKAEIQQRHNQSGNIIMHEYNENDHITPGGPPINDNNNDSNNNPFDLNQNQPTKSISYKDNINQEENEEESKLSLSMLTPNAANALKIGHYVWDNRQYVILGTGVIVVYTITQKISNMVINRNDNNNNQSYEVTL